MSMKKIINGVGNYEAPLCTTFSVETEGMLCLSGNTEKLGNTYGFSWMDMMNQINQEEKL